MTTINIAKDFARFPFGRFRDDGPYSGQRFREEFLEKEIRAAAGQVEVVLDGASGMGSSFLEEAIGGLVRSGIPKATVLERLRVVSSDATREKQIRQYIEEAQPAVGKKL